jgi:hypothetical protein
VCVGVAYIGAPLSEVGPKAIRPLVFAAMLSYFASFVLASRELGVIQGERQQGYYSSTQRSHRAHRMDDHRRWARGGLASVRRRDGGDHRAGALRRPDRLALHTFGQCWPFVEG